ncbi:MAG: cytochrome c maturation protein CcmE [Nitrospinota bacterium]|nr:cytochrome c maturation protein CcmE [Nitrospinota bacterium]
MNKAQKKFLAGASIIVLAIGYLIFTGVNASGSYYYTVSEVQSMGPKARNIFLRLEGSVLPGSIANDAANLKLRFRIVDKSKQSMPVEYKGTAPDMFQDETSVVVEGKLAENGTLIATKLLTSCPSRYDAAKEMKEAS